MSLQRKKIALATVVVVTFFAVYETAKTLLFPAMSVTTSHIVTTIVVGIITVFFARYVIFLQANLLRSREESNHRLRETLAKSERDEYLLRSIVASVAEGLVITDPDSNVLLVNDAARSLLGVGMRATPRLTDITRDPQVHRAFAAALAATSRAEARIETRSIENGAADKRILRLHAAPLRLDEDDQIDGVVGVFIDITTLERLERVRQEFLSNVSHELRTPLASITAYTETLLDGAIDDVENSLRFLGTIQRNAERMRALVNDISELSAIESGAVKLKPERFSLLQLVHEIFAGLAPRALKQGVRMEARIPEESRITADRRRMEQILVNLVDNAIKFNRPGGVVAVASEVSQDALHHVIRVRDTGPGIPAEHLPRVFERFYRVDKARSREAGGTGLGLAIVKHLARAHGGEAYVTSEVAVGSEFSIKIPCRSVAGSSMEETQPEAAAYASKS